MITSAGYDQPALDVLQNARGYGKRSENSPFAEAFLEALAGGADRFPAPDGDGVITANELYQYLRDEVEPLTQNHNRRQTPGIWPLRKHDKGEFIFHVPGHELQLKPAPELTPEMNPYRGLEAFDESHTELFFGREKLEKELEEFIAEHPLTIVLGASGTGKSSLVKAGLVPRLRQAGWQILPSIRPGEEPLKALARSVLNLENGVEITSQRVEKLSEALADNAKQLVEIVRAWGQRYPDKRLLLVVDQLEELVTLCRDEKEQKQFFKLLRVALTVGKQRGRIILTLRSDFEPQFLKSALKPYWMTGRFLVKPMTQDELREVIERPAAERVMVFEPHDLVERLINEVVQMPGALPLLSFTLSELYRRYYEYKVIRNNRALTQADYEVLKGVTGSLTQRATQEYNQLVKDDPPCVHTVKRVMLRMVAIEGGELARRRVPRSELIYADTKDNWRVEKVIQQLTKERLLVEGQEPDGEPYVEPAHDVLIQGWNQLQRWKNEEQENLSLQRLLTPAAREWSNHQSDKKAVGFLWNNNPRLDLLATNLKSSQSWLNQLERRFVHRSLNRRRNNNLRLVSSLLTVILALSGLTVFAFLQQAEAQRQKHHCPRKCK